VKTARHGCAPLSIKAFPLREYNAELYGRGIEYNAKL
jgi:hypothetical protein